MKTFCSSCGSVNLYESQRPKFCCECGYSMAGTTPPQRQSYTPQAAPQSQAAYVDIDDIELDIDVPEKKSGVLFEDLAKEAPIGIGKRKKIGKAEFKKIEAEMTTFRRIDVSE